MSGARRSTAPRWKIRHMLDPPKLKRPSSSPLVTVEPTSSPSGYLVEEISVVPTGITHTRPTLGAVLSMIAMPRVGSC